MAENEHIINVKNIEIHIHKIIKKSNQKIGLWEWLQIVAICTSSVTFILAIIVLLK